MTIRTYFLCFICCLWAAYHATQAEAQPIRFIDDSGKKISLQSPAKRIISLYSAHTENLFSLGLDEEIIGVGRSDTYPPQALEKPRFDYRSDPEKVIASNPDLVLIRPFIQRSHPEFVALLEQVGLTVVSLYPESFEDFDEYIGKLALLTGKEEDAERLLQEFHRAIQAIQTTTRPIVPKPRVYFESVERGYQTVTPDSLPARAIQMAGGINIAGDAVPIKAGSSIAAYGVERLLEHAADIDVYIIQQGVMHAGATAETITERPGFHIFKAVKEGRIYIIDEKLISSPTFRYIQGIRELARMLYPDLFSDAAR